MENLAVITTKFVLEDNSPIVSVFKDEEGDWQFFGKEKGILEEDARVIKLEEILRIDKSIGDILAIKNRSHVWREDAG
ncbi:hypothetical protein SAMN05421841_1843 [Chryseobacterium wanjuense]|uniref:DUF2185 domain-containing protein n=1 Tax=Chryseobacterium wanjuense TaxID=356305 RepID=A0A1I0QDW4_9FLAO|nr:hypothetical protein [Chryseobacterium wanjuense]SEW25262.1 hypothetical protein SAMN05421841_1843 [Chryseobacterium wanjuense]